MATNISTIGAGQDYTTPTAWEAAVQGDFVTAGNIEKGEMIDQVFTDHLTIDGSTTDASNYLWLTFAAGAANDGTAGNGARIVPTTTGHIITVSDPFTRIEGLELDLSSVTGTSDECVRLNQDNILVRNCLLHTGTSRSAQDGIYLGANNSWTLTVQNCGIYGFGRAGIHIQNYQGTATVTANIANCTVIKCGGQAESGAGNISAREEIGNSTVMNVDNCLCMAKAGGNDFQIDGIGNTAWAGDGNISSDITCQTRFGAQTANLNSRTATANAAPGAGDWVIFTNITGGSEDYRLVSNAENDAEGNGLDLSGTFTDDFFGTTRSNWDSGFHEIAAGGTTYSKLGGGLSLGSGLGADVAEFSKIGAGLAIGVGSGADVFQASEAGEGLSVGSGGGGKLRDIPREGGALSG